MSIYGTFIWIEGISNGIPWEENGPMDTIPNQEQIVEIPRKQIGKYILKAPNISWSGWQS